MEGNGEEEIASNSGTDQEVTPSATMEKIPEKCSRDLSSNQNNQEDQLQHARVEMGEVREENERLKSLLPEIVQDYQSLQKHVIDVLRREETCRKPVTPIPPVKANWESDREPEELVVSLTLGRSLSGKTRTEDARNIDLNDAEREDEMSKEELRLRLGCTYPEQGSGEPAKKQLSHEGIKELKEDEIAEIWPPSKILKTMKSADYEPSQPTQVKRARVSVRVRCDTPTINDGCQWRKYGQKIAKGNPCPRAYYRCTASPSCPVRKQVQRCAEDMSVLITTYEGDHNHPLSVSATAMASTTSAAASVLQSRSSSSSQQDPEASTTPSNNSITTTSASLHGLDFSSSRDWKLNQLYVPNSSISTCSSHPTITLDLTTPINASNYNRFTSNLFTSHPPKHSSTSPCLDFSSSSTSLGSSQLLSPWDSLEYGAKPTARSIQFQNGSLNLGRQATHEHPFKPYLQMNGLTSSSHQSIMTDTVAATRAIPTSPYFHSILMAALSSCVGSGLGYRDKAENSDLKCLKPGGSSSADCTQMSSQNQVPARALNVIGNPMNVIFQQEGGLINLFPPSLSLSTSKDANPGLQTKDYKDRVKFLANSSA